MGFGDSFKSIRIEYNNLYNYLSELKKQNDIFDSGLPSKYTDLSGNYDEYISVIENKKSNQTKKNNLKTNYDNLEKTQATIYSNIDVTNATINYTNQEIEKLNFNLDHLEAADKMKYMIIDNELLPQIGVLDTNITNTNNNITNNLYTYLQLIENQNDFLKNKIKNNKSRFSIDDQKNNYKKEINSMYGTINAYLFVFYYILYFILCYEIYVIQTNMNKYTKFAILFFCFFIPFIKIIVFTLVYSELFSLSSIPKAMYNYFYKIIQKLDEIVNNYSIKFNNLFI
jgi:hypothetical protein